MPIAAASTGPRLMPEAPGSPPSALFIGVMYAGHKTRFNNLRAHTEHDGRIRPVFREITGWREDGWIERLKIVPAGLRGRARAIAESSAFAMRPRPDVIWSSAVETLAPHLWSQVGPLRRPVLLDMDWTFEQGEELAPTYFGRPARRGVRRIIARAQERALWRSVALFLPWSRWAAASLAKQGIDERRIRVIPPGVDLETWAPPADRHARTGDKLRVLFVGGDFARKGGPTLLDVFRSGFADRMELDIVTRDGVPSAPGVRVHRTEPNSAELRELYANADLFVLPTRAEAFGIATTEAMASGLPVIVTDIGGARDIVDDGETGWLIEANAASLCGALSAAWARRTALPAMGRRARAVAEERFDGRRNDSLIVDLMVEQARLHGHSMHRGTRE